MTPGTEKVKEWATKVQTWKPKPWLKWYDFPRWIRWLLRGIHHWLARLVKPACLAYGAYLRRACEEADARYGWRFYTRPLTKAEKKKRRTGRLIFADSTIAVWKETLAP